jgi:hypothetical protein
MTSILYPALISSIIETTITHPIDVIKIHKQTSKPILYNFNTLYSGYIPRSIGNIPSRTIFLFSQDYLHNYFNNKNRQVNKNIQSILIPFIAGFSQTLVDTPVEVLKMNKIMKIKNNLQNNLLYKGFIPHFYRNFIFVLCVYNCKQLSNNKNLQYLQNSSTQSSSTKTALFGAVGGIIGSYTSHPLDTIKTCIQTNRNYDNFIMKDFFKGCHLRAGMGMINMFISLYVFELLKK